MAVVRCDKGHYYDNEKFTQCPHCGVLPVMQPEKPAKAKRFGFFHKDKDGAGRQAGAAIPPVQPPVQPVTPQPPVYDDRTVGISSPAAGMDDNRTIAFSQNSAPTPAYPDDDNRTIAFSHTSAPTPTYPDDDNRTIAFSHTSAPTPAYPDDDNRTIAFSHTPAPAPTYPDDDNRTIAFSHTSAPTPAYPDDDNRTIAFSHTPSPVSEGLGRNESLEDTMPVAEEPQAAAVQEPPVQQKEEKAEAVQEQAVQETAGSEAEVREPEGRFAAGWLVCVKGPERGYDFRLYKGFNRIGTSAQADIVLTEGEGEEFLCAVVYDDRGNQFYAVQQSETPSYLNGQVIQGAAALCGGDHLCVGTSEFEFVPFCRDGWNWDMDE